MIESSCAVNQVMTMTAISDSQGLFQSTAQRHTWKRIGSYDRRQRVQENLRLASPDSLDGSIAASNPVLTVRRYGDATADCELDSPTYLGLLNNVKRPYFKRPRLFNLRTKTVTYPETNLETVGLTQ